MERRRKFSIQEHPYARQRVLADIKEKEEQKGTEESTPEEDEDIIFSEEEGKTVSEIPFLHRVAGEGNLELLAQLIENGTDINVRDQDGWPPLHTAIQSGKTDCAALLIKYGAGDVYFERQKEQYMKRLQKCKKTRRKSHCM